MTIFFFFVFFQFSCIAIPDQIPGAVIWFEYVHVWDPTVIDTEGQKKKEEKEKQSL